LLAERAIAVQASDANLFMVRCSGNSDRDL
jgi:hypothetical protein